MKTYKSAIAYSLLRTIFGALLGISLHDRVIGSVVKKSGHLNDGDNNAGDNTVLKSLDVSEASESHLVLTSAEDAERLSEIDPQSSDDVPPVHEQIPVVSAMQSGQRSDRLEMSELLIPDVGATRSEKGRAAEKNARLISRENINFACEHVSDEGSEVFNFDMTEFGNRPYAKAILALDEYAVPIVITYLEKSKKPVPELDALLFAGILARKLGGERNALAKVQQISAESPATNIDAVKQILTNGSTTTFLFREIEERRVEDVPDHRIFTIAEIIRSDFGSVQKAIDCVKARISGAKKPENLLRVLRKLEERACPLGEFSRARCLI